MFQMLAGPVVFVLGLGLIFVAVNGLPRTPAVLLERARKRERPPVNGFTSGDALMFEVLTEMVALREQLTELQERVGSLKPAPSGRRAKLAS